jgi:hypothetical protein
VNSVQHTSSSESFQVYLYGEWMFSFTHSQSRYQMGGELSTSRPRSSYAWETNHSTHLVRHWMSLRTGLDDVSKRNKFSSCRNLISTPPPSSHNTLSEIMLNLDITGTDISFDLRFSQY